MRNSVDITRGYQIGKMMVRNLFAILVCIICNVVIFINFFDVNIIRIAIGVVMTVVYSAFFYTGSATFGKFDSKPYTKLEVELWRPLVWGVAIAVMNLLVFALHRFNWLVLLPNEGIPMEVSMVLNFFFLGWSAPFMGFVYGSTNGEVITLVPVLMAVVPIVSSFLGYLAGSRGFMVSEKINDVMFEKEEDEE